MSMWMMERWTQPSTPRSSRYVVWMTLHQGSNRRIEEQDNLYLNVTGIGQSTYTYTFDKVLASYGKTIWIYRSPHARFKHVMVRAIGESLILTFQTCHNLEKTKSLVLWSYAASGNVLMATPYEYREKLTYYEAVSRLREQGWKCCKMSRYQKFRLADGGSMSRLLDWDLHPMD